MIQRNGLMDESLHVWLRDWDDFTNPDVGEMLNRLQEVGFPVVVRQIHADPLGNPMSTMIQLGDESQVRWVTWAASEWVGSGLSEGETMERVVTIIAPNGLRYGTVWVEEWALPELGLELSVADCEAYW